MFAPMLPDDDQLIPFGYDSTVGIIKSMPEKLQSTTVERVEITYATEQHIKRPDGCCLINKQIKRTLYVVKNNSADRTIRKFYIDHVADASHGGFIITTKDNCIKSVMGFSRFEFNLPPLAVVEFVVTEEAIYSTDVNWDLPNFIIRRVPRLILDGVMKDETLSILKGIVKRTNARTALTAIEQERFTDLNLTNWRAGTSVDSTTPILGPEFLDAVEKILNQKKLSAETQKQVDSLNSNIQKIFQNQKRLRDNILSLEKISAVDLMKRYLSDLDKEEDDLAATRVKIDGLEAEKAKIDKSVIDMQLLLASSARKALESL